MEGAIDVPWTRQVRSGCVDRLVEKIMASTTDWFDMVLHGFMEGAPPQKKASKTL